MILDCISIANVNATVPAGYTRFGVQSAVGVALYAMVYDSFSIHFCHERAACKIKRQETVYHYHYRAPFAL